MTLDVSSNRFTLELTRDELVDSRFALCSIRYPDKTIGDTLGEDVQTGRLGDINLSIDGRINSFELSLNTPEEITIDNSLIVEEIRVPVGPDEPFRPCYLDADGDGLVTQEDIESIYSKGSSAGLRFDINNDGIVNDQDRVLAKEYIGTICNEIGDPFGGNLYDGVFDSIDSPMAFGYSLNRLLHRNYNDKPLFRIGMVVNTFYGTANQIADPDLLINQNVNIYMDRNQQEVYAQSPVLLNFYITSDFDGYPDGEVIYQDIFWKGSNEKLKQDMAVFYEYGKQLQEANGIPPEWDYYNRYRTRFTFSTAKILIVYDQSGNGKNALIAQRSNANIGNPENFINHCQFHNAPIVVSKGEVTVNENGKIAFSHDGSHAGDIEGLGRDEVNVKGASLGFSELGQPLYAPSTSPFASACVYTVKTMIGPNYSRPGLGEQYDSIDILEVMAQNYEFDSLSDIFLEDGTIDPNFNIYVGDDGSSSGADRRDIYVGFGATDTSLFGGQPSIGHRMYHQTGGQHIDWLHPYVVLTGVSQNSIIEYEDYVGGYAPLKEQMQSGAKSFYLRMANATNFGNYNQACGHKKMREGAVCAMTIATLPQIDFRINNDQIVSGINLNTPHGRYQPSVLPYNEQRESFSEMAGFDIQNDDDYAFIAEEVNNYYQTTPFETASNPPL